MRLPQCPKCRARQTAGAHGYPECCQACGLYFAKWADRDLPARRPPAADTASSPAWLEALRVRFRHVPDNTSSAELLGRAALLLALFFWGGRLTLLDYRSGEMGGSFMHAILLPIHEAGHVLFIPFGRFMTVLGGSLFQLLLPLIAAATLLWQNRDAFGAGIGIWWCGTSLLDLAPYIYDAKNPQLMLLGGHTGEDGPHDWIYLLGVFGGVHKAPAWGAIAHGLGVIVMLAGLMIALNVLWRMRKRSSA
jgi:hypothetical protein